MYIAELRHVRHPAYAASNFCIDNWMHLVMEEKLMIKGGEGDDGKSGTG